MFALRELQGRLWLAALLAAILLASPANAAERADNSAEQLSWPGQQPAATATGAKVQVIPTGGVRLGRGATDFMNDKFGICRWLDNFSTENEFFVPDGDAVGWSSFVANAPSAVRIDKCCPAQPVVIASSDGMQGVTKSLGVGRARLGSPYASTEFHETFLLGSGDTEAVTVTYQCTDAGWTSTTSRTVTSATGTPTVEDTGCGISPMCQGRAFVIYDTCTNTVLSVESNSRACGCDGLAGKADSSAANDVDCGRVDPPIPAPIPEGCAVGDASVAGGGYGTWSCGDGYRL